MKLQELAEQLTGGQYPFEPSSELQQLAKDNNYVIVFGASDDLWSFAGR